MTTIEESLAYLLPNLSYSTPIGEEHFLQSARHLTPLEKVSSFYLKLKCRKDCLQFLEYLVQNVQNVVSTVAARSFISQGLGCFCRKIIIGEDYYSAFNLFGNFLMGFRRKSGSTGLWWSRPRQNFTPS